jgi:G3E family GTPase
MTPERVPVTIVGGFLGSGKTTRVNALLRAPRGRRIAVVLNEIGEVGVDAARLAGAEEFVELDGGCVCCALNADLEATLARLRTRGGFDHLVVETTGIGDPLPVAWTFERPGLREGYRVDAVATVVDALNLERLLVEAHEAAIQIERADVLLASKLDLAPGGLANVARLVRPLNPVAPLLPAPPEQTPWDLLLDEVAGARPAPESGAGAHAHGQRWETWRFRTAHVVSDARLEEFLRALPAGLYRVKGLVRTDAPGWMEVHAVGGRYEVEPCAPVPAPDASTLVGVGRGFDRTALDAAAAELPVRGSASPPR